MHASLRWTLVASVSLIWLSAGGFAYGYSSIERTAAFVNRMALPQLTHFMVHATPIALGFWFIITIGMIVLAIRRHDRVLTCGSIVIASFAFGWTLLCILAWKLPYMYLLVPPPCCSAG